MYDRIEHPFSYKDILRIAKKVNPRSTPEDAMDDIFLIVDTIDELFTDLLEALVEIAFKFINIPVLIGRLLKFVTITLPNILYHLGYRP